MAEEKINKTFYKKEPNSGKYTYNLLIHMKNEIKRSNETAELRQNALFLEWILNTIAGYKYNYNDEIYAFESDMIKESLTELLGENYEGQFGINNNPNIMKILNIKKDQALTGTNFERYMDYLLNNIKKSFEGKEITKSYNKQKNGIGTEKVALGLNAGSSNVYTITKDKDGKEVSQKIINDLVSDVTDEMLSRAYKESSKMAEQSRQKYAEEHHIKREPVINAGQSFHDITSGKIDNAINININYHPDPILNRLASILKNTSFSDKAYLSTNELVLGKTNAFRAYMAVSSRYPGMTSLEKYYRWYRLVKCMELADEGNKKHKEHKTAKNFYQLRYLYELTGYGLQYIKPKIQETFGSLGAEYLVFHKPGKRSGKIMVVSTSAVAEDLIQAMENDQIWRSMSLNSIEDIDKGYALNATIKLRIRSNILEYGTGIHSEYMNKIPKSFY